MLRYQPTPHVLVARPYADVLLRTRKVASHLFVACSPKSRFFPPLVAYLPKSRLFPPFVACSPKSRVFPPHTPTPPHHTERGYKSRLFPLIPCSPKSRFSHLFLHVRKIHAYSHFLLRKKLRNLHLFCETPSVFPLLLHVCQNHAYSHLLLHVRRNHVYSLHTQSIKEFLRFCEKSRKFNFFLRN